MLDLLGDQPAALSPRNPDTLAQSGDPLGGLQWHHEFAHQIRHN